MTHTDGGSTPLPPETEQRPSSSLSPPSPELELRVRRALALQPPPARAVVARQTAALTIGSWLITVLVFFLAGGARPLGRPLSLVVGTALGIAAASALAGWAALGRGRSMLGRARHLLVPISIGAPLAILAWKVFWSAQYAGALSAWPTRPGLRCLILSLSLGLCPLVAFAIARCSSDPRRPTLTGFAAGVALGCITSLLTDLWCPVAYLPHLLLGHLVPIALLGVLGAWLGRHFIAQGSTTTD
jgi:hypothetical protein